MLEGDEFIRRVVPSLSRLFASSDRNLRRNLLESIESFGPHLTQVGSAHRVSPAPFLTVNLLVVVGRRLWDQSCRRHAHGR